MPRHHLLNINGTLMTKSGIDGMTTDGTTGAHPSQDSRPSDGPGTRDTGITTVGSSNTSIIHGGDSSPTSGLSTQEPSQSSQSHQEAQRTADNSGCSRKQESQPPSHLELFQDAKLDQERKPYGTCGKTIRAVNSLVERKFIKSWLSVRLENHMFGLKSEDVSKVQSSTRRD